MLLLVAVVALTRVCISTAEDVLCNTTNTKCMVHRFPDQENCSRENLVKIFPGIYDTSQVRGEMSGNESFIDIFRESVTPGFKISITPNHQGGRKIRGYGITMRNISTHFTSCIVIKMDATLNVDAFNRAILHTKLFPMDVPSTGQMWYSFDIIKLSALRGITEIQRQETLYACTIKNSISKPSDRWLLAMAYRNDSRAGTIQVSTENPPKHFEIRHIALQLRSKHVKWAQQVTVGVDKAYHTFSNITPGAYEIEVELGSTRRGRHCKDKYSYENHCAASKSNTIYMHEVHGDNVDTVAMKFDFTSFSPVTTPKSIGDYTTSSNIDTFLSNSHTKHIARGASTRKMATDYIEMIGVREAVTFPTTGLSHYLIPFIVAAGFVLVIVVAIVYIGFNRHICKRGCGHESKTDRQTVQRDSKSHCDINIKIENPFRRSKYYTRGEKTASESTDRTEYRQGHLVRLGNFAVRADEHTEFAPSLHSAQTICEVNLEEPTNIQQPPLQIEIGKKNPGILLASESFHFKYTSSVDGMDFASPEPSVQTEIDSLLQQEQIHDLNRRYMMSVNNNYSLLTGTTRDKGCVTPALTAIESSDLDEQTPSRNEPRDEGQSLGGISV